MPNCRITTDLVFEIFDVKLNKWFPIFVRGNENPKISMDDKPDETGIAMKIEADNFITIGAKNYRVNSSYFQLLNVDTGKYHTIWVDETDENNPTISISKQGDK